MAYDLVIKNGTVVDGSGAPRHQTDIAVAGGKIVEIGKIKEDGEKNNRCFGPDCGARLHRSSYPLRCADVLGFPDDMFVMAWCNHRYYRQLWSWNCAVPARSP